MKVRGDIVTSLNFDIKSGNYKFKIWKIHLYSCNLRFQNTHSIQMTEQTEIMPDIVAEEVSNQIDKQEEV